MRRRSMIVRDWMKGRVTTVRPDARLGRVARLMRARKIRHLPVVEGAGRLVGIVTARLGALPVVERDRLVGILTETDVLDAFQRVLGAAATSR